MAFQERVLWVENGNQLEQLMAKAADLRVTAIAVRGTMNVGASIDAARHHNLKIYLWRYPYTDDGSIKAAKDQAIEFLSKPGSKGVDGYFFDPEGSDSEVSNWNTDALGKVALKYCEDVAQVAKREKRIFGITSHYACGEIWTDIPWNDMFKTADVLLPQAYWCDDKSQEVCTGNPATTYEKSFANWATYGGDRGKIFPVGGEICRCTGAQVHAYAAAAAAQLRTAIHFYHFQTDQDEGTPVDVMNVIRDIGQADLADLLASAAAGAI